MKHAIKLFLLSGLLAACSGEQKPEASYDVAPTEGAEEVTEGYAGCDDMVRFSFGFKNLDELRERTIERYDFLDSVNFEEGRVTLVLSEEKGQEFYDLEEDYPESWIYCNYHDIYTALFAFEEVQEVRIMHSGENITYLPCLGDYEPLRLPAPYMKREWYGESLDYGDFIMMEDSTFYEDPELRSVKTSVLEMIGIVLNAKKLQELE